MHAPEEASRWRARAQVEAGVQTEVELLGPVEAGSSVLLEGVVWNETESGARAPLRPGASLLPVPRAPCRARLLAEGGAPSLSFLVLCCARRSACGERDVARTLLRGHTDRLVASLVGAAAVSYRIVSYRSIAFLTLHCSALRCLPSHTLCHS